MSQNANNSNNSFSHAFLPGLILGLIVGGVAGAFLPDWLGGSNIPEIKSAQSGQPAGSGSRDYPDEPELSNEELIKQAEEEAAQAGEDLGEQAGDVQEAAEEAAEDLQNNIPDLPESDG